MKKLCFPLALALIFCLLSACGSAAKDPGMAAVTEAVDAAVAADGLAQVDANYIENMLKLAPTSYEEALVLLANVGATRNEYGIFRAKDSAQAAEIKTAVEAYLQSRVDDPMSQQYMPEEYPKLQNAEVWIEGAYVLYAILDDAAKSAASTAFFGCFEG